MPTDSYNDTDVGSSERSASGAHGDSFASFRALSPHDRTAITALVETRIRIRLAQGQAREDVKAIAERLGMKSSELNKIVRLAMQERERGNVLQLEKALIEVAEQVVG